MTDAILFSLPLLLLGQAAIALDLGPRCLALWGHRASLLLWVVLAMTGVSLALWAPWLAALASANPTSGVRIWLWVHAAAGVLYFGYFLWSPLPGVVKQPDQVERLSCEVRAFPAEGKRRLRFRSARNQNLEVCRDRLHVDACGAAHGTLSLALLADIHVYYSRDLPFVNWCVEQVNAFGADVVVVLGDLTKRKRMVEATRDAVVRLEARLGGILVLGNHDLSLGPEYAARAFQDSSVRLLRPADGEVEIGPGITFSSSEWPFRKASRDALPSRDDPDDRYRILLAHSPDNLGRAVGAGFDLVVSGHTHGGFPRIPGIGPIVVPLRYGRGLADGWFRWGDTHLFVTRGIGYVPASPFQRYPQIACIDLDFQKPGSEDA